MVKLSIMPAQITAAKSGAELPTINEEWLYRLCAEAVNQRGKPGDRNVYVYREGFYRGLWVAFLLIFVSLCLRHSVPTANIQIRETIYDINYGLIPFSIPVTFVFSVMCFSRYRRFGKYRVSQGMLGFLTLLDEKEKSDKEKKGAEDVD